jgi:hypothetical protein
MGTGFLVVIALITGGVIGALIVLRVLKRTRYTMKRYDSDFHRDLRKHHLHDLVEVPKGENDPNVRIVHANNNAGLTALEVIKEEHIPAQAHIHVIIGAGADGSLPASLLPIVETLRGTFIPKPLNPPHHEREPETRALPPPTHH